MNQSSSHVCRPHIYLPVLLTAGIAVAASLAQPKSASAPTSPSNYEYVGVDNSLVRVDRDTGRVEILEQHNSPGMTLTLEQARPWTWREIRIDNRPSRPADREPRNGGRPATKDDD